LKHTPEVLAPWKTQAKKSRRDLKRFYEDILFKETVAKVKSGQFDAESCWMADRRLYSWTVRDLLMMKATEQ
jgi:hypothetical protein